MPTQATYRRMSEERQVSTISLYLWKILWGITPISFVSKALCLTHKSESLTSIDAKQTNHSVSLCCKKVTTSTERLVSVTKCDNVFWTRSLRGLSTPPSSFSRNHEATPSNEPFTIFGVSYRRGSWINGTCQSCSCKNKPSVCSRRGWFTWCVKAIKSITTKKSKRSSQTIWGEADPCNCAV